MLIEVLSFSAGIFGFLFLLLLVILLTKRPVEPRSMEKRDLSEIKKQINGEMDA